MTPDWSDAIICAKAGLRAAEEQLARGNLVQARFELNATIEALRDAKHLIARISVDDA